ncbi:putative coactivator CBP, KIX domain superfamily, mediator complex subunit 15, KIX [Helianthus annuus]|nr:putative coactivator CBP, KIX domain superfamily, mediator complex subunit 15, KIX [Helianthus annuus]KAJ0774712.1 putative coactivator CBP, KIX domain superfamily, mediator complex subunit 15, KIX [Helianthus annuus]
MKDLYLLDLRPGDWRATVQADSRQRIVNKIMDTLKRHVPFDGPEGLQELMKMAMKFEQRMYTECTSQSDYLRKISLKMLTMETRYPAANNVNPQIQVFYVIQCYAINFYKYDFCRYKFIKIQGVCSNNCTFILYDILGKLPNFVIII